MSIKIFDPHEKVSDDIYLFLHETSHGVSLGVRSRLGDHIYDILSIKTTGVHFHNLKDFAHKTPFPLCGMKSDNTGLRIDICRS